MKTKTKELAVLVCLRNALLSVLKPSPRNWFIASLQDPPAFPPGSDQFEWTDPWNIWTAQLLEAAIKPGSSLPPSRMNGTIVFISFCSAVAAIRAPKVWNVFIKWGIKNSGLSEGEADLRFTAAPLQRHRTGAWSGSIRFRRWENKADSSFHLYHGESSPRRHRMSGRLPLSFK